MEAKYGGRGIEMAGKTSLKTAVLIWVLVLGIHCTTAAGGVIYVDVNTPDNNDGSDWANAYKYLQDALADADSDPDVDEIRVAQGTYTPDSNSADPNGNGDREATFGLINGVTLKGGYAGYGAPDPNARDVGLYETILSGDLDGNDVDLNEPSDLHHDSTRSENSFSVVIGSGTDSSAVLDGFTITAGHANDLQADVNSPANNGGGMYNNSGSPTVLNCTFLRNSAKLIWSPVRIAGGGGMFNLNSSPALQNCKFVENITFTGELISAGGAMFNINSNPTLVNCVFSGNVATGFDSDYIGGGMCNYGSSPSLVDCSFVGNLAYWGGGGMFNDYNSTPALTGCTFRDNWGHYYGGAMFNERSSLILTNCAFEQNAANIRGGGIHNGRDCRSTITNCTFSANASGGGGGGMYNYYGTSAIVTNCEFVENRAGGEGGGMAGENAELILRRCTFSANAATIYGGGGLSAYRCGATITRCVFRRNLAGGSGGGLSAYRCSATITRCVFRRNLAGGSGGAVYCLWCDALLNDCTVSDNRSGRRGGGILISDSKPILTRCKFSGNWAASDGGGIYCEEISSPTISNCAITGNRAGYNGGGIFSWDASSPTVVNCTISGNAALDKGGGICYEEHGRLIVRDCIVWGNTASDGDEMAVGGASTADVNYCDVKGGREGVYVSGDYTLNWGPGNIDANPRFVEPGYWDSNGTPGDVNDDFWVGGDNHLMAASPCIDAGDPNYVPEPNETDLDGNPRVLDGDNDGNSVVDIGAYEHRIIYVDADANGANNGTSWEDAFNYLRDALAGASSGSEIWVASGIYKPDANTNEANGSGLRTATFQLMSGVLLKGGYAGYGELDPDARNVELYKTILSGDLDGNDIEVANPHDMWLEPSRVENSYHVVTGSGTDTTAVLDGFTIIGGNANDNHNEMGGGMYNSAGNPTVSNCIFTGNWASWDALGGGGGMGNYYSNPTISNCTFSDNAASCWIGGGGGGMYNEYSDPMLINCTFGGNTAASGYGGAMWNIWSNPTLANCTFTENFASEDGGAISNDYGSFQPVLTGCTFSGNIAAVDGGAIYNVACDSITLISCVFNMNSAGHHGGGMYNQHANSTLTDCLFMGNLASTGGGVYIRGYRPTNTMTLTNCTFSGNSSLNGNAVACDSFRQQYPITLEITNCILWDGGNEIWNNNDSTITITFSDVDGGWPGEGNIDADPCFVAPAYWDATGVWVEGDYHLVPGSPCIDAGDNNSLPADTADLDGDGNTAEPIPWDIERNARVLDGDSDGNSVVDMGAYEANYVEVAMKFTPQTLNPGSQGKWVKVHFVLPEGFGVEVVDANRPAVIWQVGVGSQWINVFVNEEELVEVEAAFGRAAFCAEVPAERTLDVMGILYGTSGESFYGTDTVKITNHVFEYLSGLASYWLEESCGQPDWCGGADLDQNSVVDFADFVLFEGCCIEAVAE
jgi:parallel beta-helix repeat protein/predicted outer membrane repeat protein